MSAPAASEPWRGDGTQILKCDKIGACGERNSMDRGLHAHSSTKVCRRMRRASHGDWILHKYLNVIKSAPAASISRWIACLTLIPRLKSVWAPAAIEPRGGEGGAHKYLNVTKSAPAASDPAAAIMLQIALFNKIMRLRRANHAPEVHI